MPRSYGRLFLAGGILALLAISLGPSTSGAASSRALSTGLTRAELAGLSVPFVVNQGQSDRAVRFSADLFCGRLDVTSEALVFSLGKVERGAEPVSLRSMRGGESLEIDPRIRTAVLKEMFLDAAGRSLSFEPRGGLKSPTKVSFFVGNDPAAWRADVPSYQSVSLGEVWPGIGIEIKASGGNAEKVFTCEPGADPGRIRIGIEGALGLEISPEGRLVIATELGRVAQTAPLAYQERDGARRPVLVAYDKKGENVYGFRVLEPYDAARPLIIDPTLETLLASTYLGTSIEDHVRALAVDGKGNILGAGYTLDSKKRKYLAFVFKLKSDLSVLLASTYIGGDKAGTGFAVNVVNAMAVGASGAVFVAGASNCPNFPTTVGAYDTTPNGNQDVFVLRLNAGLNRILASTLIGADYWESAYALALDAAENVYLTGTTASKRYPVTTGAYDTTYNGYPDVFISSFDRALSRLRASTFLGGTSKNPEEGLSCAVTSSGYVYVSGWTFSRDFPTTPGAYARTLDDFGDVFVAKFDAALSTLVASTFLGGEENECAQSMVLDGQGNVYLAGWTESRDFPVTAGAYDTTFNDTDPNAHDAFVAKLGGALKTLLASTFLGGEIEDEAHAIALNKAGNVYVAGWTRSTGFPATPGAYDTTLNEAGIEDMFVSKFSNSLTRLLVSTFLGGSGYDYGRAVVVDGVGDIYVAGDTDSQNFPVTARAYDTTANGKTDIVLAKFLH